MSISIPVDSDKSGVTKDARTVVHYLSSNTSYAGLQFGIGY